MARNKYPQRTVEKILEVSLALFNEKGYEKTTIQDIVNALGMSKGAIYHHFKSEGRNGGWQYSQSGSAVCRTGADAAVELLDLFPHRFKGAGCDTGKGRLLPHAV